MLPDLKLSNPKSIRRRGSDDLDGCHFPHQFCSLNKDGLVFPVPEEPAFNTILAPTLNRNDFMNSGILQQLL